MLYRIVSKKFFDDDTCQLELLDHEIEEPAPQGEGLPMKLKRFRKPDVITAKVDEVMGLEPGMCVELQMLVTDA